jgi:thiamine pyrophosphate-dependent acetolactate synthase large subunit-like protein
MNGAAVIAEILRREGTEFLSCYPRNPLIEACAALDIRPILCRQERVGVGLADGYTRIKRGKQNGVFAAQAGPGIENAFPGVAQAFSENVPLLIIPAGLPLARQYVRPVFRAADVYRPVTKWSALAHSVQELPDLMRRAYHAMRSGKGGPVLIEVPAEVWEAEYAGELDYAPVPVQRAAPDPDAVKTAVRMLLAAKHPLLLAGQGRALCASERSSRSAGRAHSGAGPHHQSGQKRDSRNASARARGLDPLAAEDGHRVHGQSRSRAGHRLEPHPHAVRARRAGRQDDHPRHQRRRRHQQGVPGRSCGDR